MHGGLQGLREGEPARGPDVAKAQHPIGEGAGKDDAHGVVAAVVGKRAEEAVDDVLMALSRLARRDAEDAAAQREVGIAWDDVDVVDLHAHAVRRLEDGEGRHAGDDVGELALVVRVEVHHEDDRDPGGGWESAEQVAGGVEPAGRGAHAHHGERRPVARRGCRPLGHFFGHGPRSPGWGQKTFHRPGIPSLWTICPSEPRMGEPPGRVVVLAGSAGAFPTMVRIVRRLDRPGTAALFLTYHRGPGPRFPWEAYLGNDAYATLEPTEAVEVRPNTIYYPRVSDSLVIEDGLIHPFRETRRACPNTDRLLTSAASNYGDRVWAFLLSGMGEDGLEGLRDVKASGGRTVVEHPRFARFPQLPSLAVDAGLADIVAPTSDIVSLALRAVQGEIPLRGGLGG